MNSVESMTLDKYPNLDLNGDTVTSSIDPTDGMAVDTASLGSHLAAAGEDTLLRRDTFLTDYIRTLLVETMVETQMLCNVIIFPLDGVHELGLKGMVYYSRFLKNGVWLGLWITSGGYFVAKKVSKGNHWGVAGAYKITDGNTKVEFETRPCKASKHDVPPITLMPNFAGEADPLNLENGVPGMP